MSVTGAAQLNLQESPEEQLKNYVDNFNSYLIKFVILTIVQIILLVYVFAGGGIAEISVNWPKYRCNPLIMPFASFFGFDATENFNYCMKNIFNLNAGAVLGPLYTIMASFTDIVSVISNVANSFRFLIANLLHGMERLMSSFRDRFQGILFSIRLSFIKIRSLMGRLYSTFYAVIYMGMSALRAADNVARNDMVQFLLEFCFDPSTPIELASGKTVRIDQLQIGDALAPINGTAPIVSSLFTFDGSQTPMVNLNDVIVSAQHYVYYKPLGQWIAAGDHPDAYPAPSIPTLYCLNTTTHTLKIGSDLFSDYDESESYTVSEAAKRTAEKMLNGGIVGAGASKKIDYSLGISGNCGVLMADGSSKSLDSIAIGDKLKGGGVVLGKVAESSSFVVNISNTYVSASQLIWNNKSNTWVRACELYPDEVIQLRKPVVLYNLISSNNLIFTRDYVYRDYREVSDPIMEESYANEFSSQKLKTYVY